MPISIFKDIGKNILKEYYYFILMDWHDCLVRRNTRIPKKEIQEQTYDYQCNTCLRWKKFNDMGIRSTGRIYLHCKRCREVRDKTSSKRTEKMEAQAK